MSRMSQKVPRLLKPLLGSGVTRRCPREVPLMTSLEVPATTAASAAASLGAPVAAAAAAAVASTGCPRPPMVRPRPRKTAPASAKPVAVKSYRELDGPTGWPLVGNFLTYVKGANQGRMHEVQMEYHQKYGNIFKEKWGSKWQVHTACPEMFEKLYRHQGKTPRRPSIRSWQHYRKLTGRPMGIVTGDGDTWLQARKLLNKKMIAPSSIPSYVRPLTDVTDDFIKRIRHVRDVEGDVTFAKSLSREFYSWGLECLGSILFERRLGFLDNPVPVEAQALIDAYIVMHTSSMNIIVGETIHQKLNTPLWKKHKQSWDDIFRITQKYLDQKLEEVEQRLQAGETLEDQKTFLTFILASHMSMPEIYVNIAEMMQGGMDTTSNSTGFVLQTLVEHPDVQERVYDEISRVLQGRSITTEDISRLPYLNAVIKEVMRLYPTATMGVRILDEDIVLDKYHVPKDTMFVMNHYAVGRDEQIFERAKEFIPERWLRGEEKCLGDFSPFASLPFGYGIRGCIGRRLAKTEMNIVLTKILQNFRLEKQEGDEMVFKPYLKVILAPGDVLPVRLIDR